MVACHYFDGRSSRPRPGTASVDGARLRVVGDDLDRSFDADRLRFAPAIGRGPARIALGDGGVVEVDDRDAAAALFAALGHRPSRPERWSSRTSTALVLLAAFVALAFAAYRWGIPWAADEAVRHAPARWDARLGAQVLDTLEHRLLRPTRLAPERIAGITDRFHALRWPDEPGAVPTVATLTFRRIGTPNAFALPGGTIVVSDELVALSMDDDDALMAVLAHEMGHVVHRDAMRQLARSTLTSIAAAWYFGDVSNAAAVIAGGIGTLRYSRDAERDADRYAIDTMRSNGRSTLGAARLFRRLEAWRPPRADDATQGRRGDGDPSTTARVPRLRVPEYLSTHPDTDDRIRRFEDAARVDAGSATPVTR